MSWRRDIGLPGVAKQAGQVREPSKKRMKLTKLRRHPKAPCWADQGEGGAE